MKTANKHPRCRRCALQRSPTALPTAERAGQKMLTLRGRGATRGHGTPGLCTDIDGFSLLDTMRVQAKDRKRLKPMCRCITRPALSDERVQRNAAAQMDLKQKTPWRDATIHLVMSTQRIMQWLAACATEGRPLGTRAAAATAPDQIPRVLEPNAMLRAPVVPQGRPVRAQPATEAATAADCEFETAQARPHRIAWASRLEHVLDIGMQHGPNCGRGELKIIAAGLARPVIENLPNQANCANYIAHAQSPRHFMAPQPSARASPVRCRVRSDLLAPLGELGGERRHHADLQRGMP